MKVILLLLLFYEPDFKGRNYADWAKTCWYLTENCGKSLPVRACSTAGLNVCYFD